MDELDDTTTEESTNLIGKFSQLPGGVQRVIIAVLLMALIAAAYYLQRLMHAEEDTAPEVIPFEPAAAFEAAMQEE